MPKKKKPTYQRGRKTRYKKPTLNHKRLSMVVLGLLVVAGLIAVAGTAINATGTQSNNALNRTLNQTVLAAQVIPQNGYTLPFKWGDVVHKLVETGALNVSNLLIILNNSGQPLTPVEKEILNGTYDGYIRFNSANTEFSQLVLWALGINNNNTIINNGPIINASTQYADQINSNAASNQKVTVGYIASNYFASTGGYAPVGSLQLGGLDLINLTSQQQALMYDVATHSYRPCCDNPTAFPDCNHGAAALGLVELLASQNANQTQMFSAIKYFYQYQFPQQYIKIAAYFDLHGENYSQVNPSEVMSYGFSSYTGFSNVNQYLVKSGGLPQPSGTGAACGA